MFVLADLTNGSFDLVDAPNCTQFHVAVVGDGDRARLDETLCEVGRVESPEVAWISVAEVRRMARLCVDDSWARDFEAMLGYATGKGWLDDAGEHIQAHIEWNEVGDAS